MHPLAEDIDPSSKLTVSKLVPIKSSSNFDRNITLAAAVKYRLSGRRKVRKSEKYTVEIFVALIRKKVKKAKFSVSTPATSIVYTSGMTDGTITTSGSGG